MRVGLWHWSTDSQRGNMASQRGNMASQSKDMLSQNTDMVLQNYLACKTRNSSSENKTAPCMKFETHHLINPTADAQV